MAKPRTPKANAYDVLDSLEGVPDMDYDGYAPVHESVDWGTVFLLNIICGVYLKDGDEYYKALSRVRGDLEAQLRMVHPENRQYAQVDLIRALLMERYRLLMKVMRKLGLMPKTSRAD
jgi:hypothetical protein